jgi:hypothetical protein
VISGPILTTSGSKGITLEAQKHSEFKARTVFMEHALKGIRLHRERLLHAKVHSKRSLISDKNHVIFSLDPDPWPGLKTIGL